MRHSKWSLRTLLWGMALLFGWTFATICEASKLEYPRPCNPCMPNVAHWGHFRTIWRQWPGELTPERTNPQSIGREVLPTPLGQEIVPPPKAAKPPLPEPSLEEPPEEAWPTIPEGIIQPPEGLLLPEHRPGVIPSVPGGEMPLPEGGLPGLPPQEPLPGLPNEQEPPPQTPANKQPSGATGKNTSKSTLPTLPTNATSQKGTTASSPAAGTQGAAKSSVHPATQTTPPQKPKVETKQPVPAASSSTFPQSSQLEPVWPSPQEGNSAFRTHAPAVSSFNAAKTNKSDMVLPVGGIAPERNEVLPAAYRCTSPRGAGSEARGPVQLKSYPLENLPARAEIAARPTIPPVALKGYCPVELVRNGRWVAGDVQWTVVYKGWIYRFSGAQQRRDFLADPESYIPVNSSNDVVLSLDAGREVPGVPAYCALYNGRLYMFSSAATQAQFNRDPKRYAGEK